MEEEDDDDDEEKIPANNLHIFANKIASKEKYWTINYRDACSLFAFVRVLFTDIFKLFAGISPPHSDFQNNYFLY